MLFSLYTVKYTMHLKIRLSRWLLLLVHKRQYGIFENFGPRITCGCDRVNLNVGRGNTGITIKLHTNQCVNKAITAQLFRHSSFLSYPFASLRKFHTASQGNLCVKSSQLLLSQHCHQRHCWNCGRDTHPARELFFCDCGVVQKPACELTYFDLMQLKPSFDIDTKSLGDMFRETQKRLHPDKFSAKKQVCLLILL